jgi:hypothetical protein
VKTQPADLASAGRAGTFARRKARTAQRDYLRRGWRVLLGLYVGLVVTTAWPALIMPNGFLAGLVVGLSLAGSAGALVSVVIIQTGTGPVMAGESAEQWTVEELKDLLEHGHRLVNHVVVDGRGDADHVLVGPAGVFVLETKWSATPFTPQGRWIGEVVRRLERRAERTRLQSKRLGVQEVTPVLVLWGPAARPLVEGTGWLAAAGRSWSRDCM